jgi:hypothetical protein
MKRRDFIKLGGLAAAGTIAAPYILPTGRLFASTGTRLVNHVVFVLFAGGLRNQETVDMQYIASQGGTTEGNIMSNILKGNLPSQNLIFNPYNAILNRPLAEFGTLFKEVRYAQGPTGHYNGHTVAMTGNYTSTGLNLNVNPDYPTIFEYYRKHMSPEKSALNCWWLSEALGPYPSLNYSRHPEYGAKYGANYLNPLTVFFGDGANLLQNLPEDQPDDITRQDKIKFFLNKSFEGVEAENLPGIIQSAEDRERVAKFIKATANKTLANQIEWPIPAGLNPTQQLNSDLINIAYSWEVLKEFTPELTVINTFSSDVCHNNFTSYINNLHKADYGVGWLWNKIQSNPKLKDNTLLVVMPEHGRNLVPNNIRDNNGFQAIDHTSDDNSRRIFTLVAGPQNVVKQNQVLGSTSNPIGESIDVIPTIAHALGFYPDIPKNLLPGRVLNEAFA